MNPFDPEANGLTYGTVAEARRTATPRGGDTQYGAKIPTSAMVRLDGDRRMRRVYAICFGNAASLYVIKDGWRVFLRDTEVDAALAA